MELKELLDSLDLKIDGDVTPENFLPAFQEKYIPKLQHDEYRKTLSSAFTAIDSGLKETAKKILGEEGLKDVRFKNDDDTPVKTSDLVKVIGGKIYDEYERVRSEAANPDKDGKVKKLHEDFEKFKTLAEQKDSELMELRQQLEKKEQTYTEKLAESELNHQKAELFKGLKWAKEAHPDAKEGFLMRMNSKYKIEVRDGKKVIFDTNGETIKNKNGTAVLSPEEVLDSELEEAKLKELNSVKRDSVYKEERIPDGELAGKRKGLRLSQTNAALEKLA
jgi:hypothetical protein